MLRRTRGDSRLPPLIFLHGFLGTGEDWEEMLPFFEERYFCIAYDLPESDIVAAVKKEIEKISPKPILIGYSMGGRIALQLQEHAAAVVALSANPGLKSEEQKEIRRKADEEWAQKILHRPWREFLDEWYGQSIFASLHGKPLLKTIIDKRLKSGSRGNAQVMREMSLANQMAVEEFSVPTLMMYGEEDWKFRDLYSTLPEHVCVRGIKNSGHCLNQENPIDCATEILKWIEDVHRHSLSKAGRDRQDHH